MGNEPMFFRDLKKQIFLMFSNIPTNWPTWCVYSSESPLLAQSATGHRHLVARKNRESMASWHRFCVAIHEPPTEPSLGKRQGNPCSSLASSLIDF